MSSAAQQLKEDFELVQKLLEIYPDIKIISTEGDPPEQYDIEYTIKGYKKNPEGDATPDNNHEVRITLPFGYPHFPPTAKPITPIFHPDIDPDAIRIADFWQENHSLPDLIVHIGQMICGNHYTKDEPFNQDAFEWFQERSSWLPFDVLEPKEDDDTEKVETDSPTSDTEAQQSFAPAADLDILKDDFDFPFDDDEFGTDGDKFPFDLEEDAVTDELAELDETASTDEITFDPEEDAVTDELDETTSTDEITFDPEEKDSSETLDLQENDNGDTEDLFSLETDETEDDISFDLTGETDETESTAESSLTDDLFALETEPTDEEGDEETALEFDSEDITSAFEEDGEADDITLDDITLDDLAGLDEEEDARDFGIADESMDLDGGDSADLSGLDEEAAEDTIEDTDLDLDETSGDEEKILSALSLDEEVSSADKPGEKSQVIRSLIEQKQIFSAKKILTELPDPDSLPDKQELELTIADGVAEAEDLYKKADGHEQKGEFEKAGILLDLVANIAIDFPGLDFSRNRIRESMMADSMATLGDATADGKEAAPTKDGETDASATKAAKKKKKARAKLSFKIPTRLIVILLAVVALGGIGAGAAFIYNNDSQSVQLAKASFQKAAQMVDSKEFKNAKKELDVARIALEKVLFFQGKEKETISSKITGITNSSLFKEGLKGRVLYGDQFYSVETAKAIDKFNTQKSYAEKVLKSNKLEQAIVAYEKSLPYAEKAGFEDQIKSISRKITELRLEVTLTQAKQLEEEQNWLQAEEKYQKAQELAKTISTAEVQSEISNQLATAAYQYGLQEGLKAINDSQWQKSIDAFQRVQNILQENPQIVPETKTTEIDKLLVQSRLFYGLSQARIAYENEEWKHAIDTYNDAIALMETNTSLLGHTEAKGNIKKINKTILTTHVAREQAKVAATTAANELDKTAQHYDAIVTLIEKSPFKDDEVLHTILIDAQTKTIEIKKQLLINSREKWLMDNYDQIFRDNYPSAQQSELLRPKVRFIKREENIMIFNMSCSERKQGRTFRLELNYQYDLDKDAWSIYSGTIEEE